MEKLAANKDHNLVWIDLEMTGLDPARQVIVEIATIVTDPDLNILAEGPNLAVRRTEDELSRIEEWSARTHKASGLLGRVQASDVDAAAAEGQTLDFLREWVPAGASPLCGNSVHQDRRFLRREMPVLDAYFHYRIVDVSTIKELAKRWFPNEKSPPRKPEAHLALADIRESIAELKWYRDHLFKPVQGEADS
jgi:oligoribonuclease